MNSILRKTFAHIILKLMRKDGFTMLITKKELFNSLLYPISEDAFFLCIDTTGLQADVSAITTIGTANVSGNTIFLRQYFNENGLEQKDVLEAFLSDISDKQAVITYYGNRFALPFVSEKCDELRLENPITSMNSLDYYEILHPMKNMLGLANCRQISVEKAFGMKRTQNLSGKKLVKTYQDYIKQPTNLIRDKLLLHNEDTLRILLKLSSVFSYQDLINGNFKECKFSGISDDCASFWIGLPNPLPHPFECHYDFATLYANDKNCVIDLPLDSNQCIKHYFQNFKDYYYLQEEDRAIHKSLASYVPREYKKKATIHTCYEKIPIDHALFLKEENLRQFLKDTIARIMIG
jgi:hypothetical protein